MGSTIAFDEKPKGWTSFFSYQPDWMIGCDNVFYSIKNGQLWQHDIETVPRNNFYDVQYASSVTTIFNQEPSRDKSFKAIITESTSPWSIDFKTNYTEGSLTTGEFQQKESRWFAYLRRNENQEDLSYLNAYGLGSPQSFSGAEITFASLNQSLSIGDTVKVDVDGNATNLGTVVNVEGNTITLDQLVQISVIDRFLFGVKNSRAEGGNLRGYYMEATLENNSTTFEELFAVNAEAVPSHV